MISALRQLIGTIRNDFHLCVFYGFVNASKLLSLTIQFVSNLPVLTHWQNPQKINCFYTDKQNKLTFIHSPDKEIMWWKLLYFLLFLHKYIISWYSLEASHKEYPQAITWQRINKKIPPGYSLYLCLIRELSANKQLNPLYSGDPKRVIGKQCTPRSDAAERCIWSGSPLFANSSTIFL